MPDRRNWTRDEEILAMALYCKVPFNKISKNNPQIIELAQQLDRTPGSVGMKMGNLGRFDPELIKRGIVGLQNGSKLDEIVWNEFYNNMEKLTESVKDASERLGVSIFDEEIQIPLGATTESEAEVRLTQGFFRDAVLSAYDDTCCITGINIKSLLQACHIKPYRESDPVTERTNPRNGLCLNALHHEAFDAGIITVDTDYFMLLSQEAKDRYSSTTFDEYFRKYEGKKITLPNRFMPLKEMLEYHNQYVFKG